jgi:hypothetical protein
MSAKMKHLLERIGWSCFLRDQVLALGIRQPTRIRHGEFSIPLLDEVDFDIRSFPFEVVDMLNQCDLLQNTASSLDLPRCIFEITKLCKLLGNVFSMLYTESYPKLGATADINLVLMPRNLENNVEF